MWRPVGRAAGGWLLVQEFWRKELAGHPPTSLHLGSHLEVWLQSLG